MKNRKSTGLNSFLIIVIVITLFLTTNVNSNPNLAANNENFSSLKVEQINLNDLNFFDISEFTNTSHTINVTREIVANQYGYTTTRTEIYLYNNASKAINAFNYTIPTHEYQDIKYLKIYSSNDTDSETEWSPIEENNETTVLLVKIPSVESKKSSIIVIQMDHPNAIKFEEGAKLEEQTFPYNFNLSFLPLISFPITSYKLNWIIGKDTSGIVITPTFDNDTLQPKRDKFTGNFLYDSQGLIFENITNLTSINRSLLNLPKYGSYNISALSNLSFIPAYNLNLAQNLTSYLSFDYYQDSYTKIEFTSLKTVVMISEWGEVTTKHEIIIRNSGIKSGPIFSTALGSDSKFPNIEFYIPDTAASVKMSDWQGNQTPTISVGTIIGKKLVQIRPRIEIEQGDEYSFQLSYQEKTSDNIKISGSGKVQLHTPLSLDFNWTVRRFELNILMPFGSNFKSETIVNVTEQAILREAIDSSNIIRRELLGIFNKAGTEIIFENLTPLSNRYINIEFGLAPLYPMFTPLSISILFLLLGLIYIIARNISFGFRPKKIALEEIPLDLIKEFVKSYEEKTAIREQILRLDRKRKSKNISAREYEKTRIILQNRQQRTDRTIVNVSRKLSEEGQRYRISMRSIEVAEAKRENILQNIDSLERKKTQGTIGKEAYAKLKLSYDKQLRSANNDVDKVLIELRSLLTK